MPAPTGVAAPRFVTAGSDPQPTVRRLRPPSWRDPRLLIGLILVLGSVGLTARLFAVADRTVPVYAARVTLPTGTALASGQVVVARLRLTGATGAYLDAAKPLPSGLVVQRTIGRGELLPVSALSRADSLAARPVTVPLTGGVPAGIAPGGRVDVWATPSGSGASGASTVGSASGDPASGSRAGDGRPRRIAEAVEVYHVTSDDRAGLGTGRGDDVQILVGEGELPDVLAALAQDEAISLLPVPGSVP